MEYRPETVHDLKDMVLPEVDEFHPTGAARTTYVIEAPPSDEPRQKTAAELQREAEAAAFARIEENYPGLASDLRTILRPLGL